VSARKQNEHELSKMSMSWAKWAWAEQKLRDRCNGNLCDGCSILAKSGYIVKFNFVAENLDLPVAGDRDNQLCRLSN